MTDNAAVEAKQDASNNTDEVIIVAVDNGYADQKAAFWSVKDGKPVIDAQGEPEITQVLLPSRAQIGAINIDINGMSSGVYRIDGQPWTVGRDVTEPESIRGERYAYSEMNAVLVNHTLIKSGFSGRKIRLATGLPFGQIYRDGDVNTALVERVKESLKSEVIPQGQSKAPIIVAHEVFPESTAAFVDYAIDCKTGTMALELETGMAVVDIGGNTTDITYINPIEGEGSEQQSYTMNRERSGSKNIGVLNVRDRLRELIKQRFKVDSLRDSQLDKALRSGVCKIFGAEEDVSEQIGIAKRDVVKKLMNYVEEMVGDAADLDFILFVGGGSAVLQDVISEYKHARVPKDPQFANARGMLKYMTYVRN